MSTQLLAAKDHVTTGWREKDWCTLVWPDAHCYLNGSIVSCWGTGMRSLAGGHWLRRLLIIFYLNNYFWMHMNICAYLWLTEWFPIHGSGQVQDGWADHEKLLITWHGHELVRICVHVFLTQPHRVQVQITAWSKAQNVIRFHILLSL